MNTEHLHGTHLKQFPTTKEMRERALALLLPLPFDTTISYQQFTETLGLNPMTDHRARSAVLLAGKDLLKGYNKKIVNIRTEGYRIIRPNEHCAVSKRQQQSARRRLKESLQTVTHVALDQLAPTEIAQVMLEQARAAIQLSLTRKLGRMKQLPPRQELHLPSSNKIVEMMKKKTG